MKQIMTASRFFTKFGFLATALILALIAMNFLSRSEEIVNAETPQKFQLARWSDETQISAAQRGNPWINVQDGKEILLDFAGADTLRSDFEANQSRPLSIATADFDKDGMPDIVTGYANGAASFMRANVDAVYPNSPEAKERKGRGEFTDVPFLSPAQVFALPTMPHFLAAGDFDADGHFDIAAAARNETVVHILKGDGRGEFVLSNLIELPGKVTALLADDFNRRDGLNDLIIAVQTEQNSQLFIFENPYGAIKAQPEIFTFAAPIKSLGIGSIAGDAHFDLAIAAGNELGILRGRDRNLLLDGKMADAPKLTRQQFDFEIDALAVGEFIKDKTSNAEIALLANDGKIHLLQNTGNSAVWDKKESISLPDNLSNSAPILLTARVSARSIDTLIVGSGERIHLLTSDVLPPKTKNEAINYDAQKFDLAASLDVAGKTVAVLPMRLNVDALSDLVVMRENSVAPAILQTAPMASFVVNSNGNGEDCDGNDNQCAICPVINNICTLEAAFTQLQSTQGASSITFDGVSGSIVRGVHYGFAFPLTIDGTGNLNGFVETTGTGFDLGNDSHVVRGMVMNANNPNVSVRHIILENSGNSIVEGNRLGTNATGTGVGQGSANGVEIIGDNMSDGNTIGGIAPVARNIISGNETGIIISAPGSTGTKIQGNYIGTDKDGGDDLGNGTDGIVVDRTTVKIGGTGMGEGNLISGNGANGIRITGTFGAIPSGVILIQGNYIGTTETGLSAIGNAQKGIVASVSQDVSTIGGTTPEARNIISGNGSDGVFITTDGTGSMSLQQQVLGNYIGTNAAGNAAIPNGGLGLYMDGNLWKVVSNNVISGNMGGGAHFNLIDDTGNDVISNNKIGTDSTGTARLGNNGIGLLLSNVNNLNVSGNYIAANSSHGISSLGTGIIYENNFIGTNPALLPTLGNGGDGMRFNGEFQSRIGGGGINDGNTIAFNRGNGITLVPENSTQENRIIGNSIFRNHGLGIDLNNDGVTVNDDCDIDTGQNGLQNYPVLSSVRTTPTANGLRSRAVGTLNSADGGNYDIHFYANQAPDSSGFGEGKDFLGSVSVSVPAGLCQVDFTTDLPFILTGNNRCVAATATDSLGNTSEFSSCVFTDAAIWLGPDDGNWDNPMNWSTGFVPTATDNATIPDNATININGGNFNAQTLSVGTNATLTIAAGSSLTIEDGTNYGTITGAGTLNFIGTSLGNNGTISVAAVNAQVGTSGNKVLAGTGGFVGNTLTIASGVTLALETNHQFNEIDTQGVFDTASRTVSLGGANPLQGTGNINTFGTIIFDGAAAQTVSRSINFNSLTINNAAGVTFGGSANYFVAGTLNLTDGILNITSSNPLTFENNANTIRTNGYITGAARKNFTVAGLPSFTFPIGTANGYSPVTVNIPNGTTTVTASVIQTNQPATNPATSLHRYWTLSGTGTFTANLTFNYLDGDVFGNENNYHITRVSGGVPLGFPNDCASGSPCVNTTANTAFISGVTAFSDWTLGELAPTAAEVSVGGRVTTAKGNGIYKAMVSITNGNGQTRTSLTNSFGYYRFDEIPVGETYIFSVRSKEYQFANNPQILTVFDEISDLDFTAQP